MNESGPAWVVLRVPFSFETISSGLYALLSRRNQETLLRVAEALKVQMQQVQMQQAQTQQEHTD